MAHVDQWEPVAVFDRQYKDRGIGAQRLYPNEQLVAFIGQRFLSLPIVERSNIKVLEVGCGSGANLWMLAKEGFDVHGVDSSETGIKVARQHLREKWGVTAELAPARFDNLPYRAETFDVIVDVVSLQHLNLEETQAAFSEIMRVLKPGGLFFSYRLSDASVMFQRGGGEFIDAATVTNVTNEAMPLANNGHMSFWSASLARQVYESRGFTLDSLERYGRTYDGGAYYVEYLGIIAIKA